MDIAGTIRRHPGRTAAAAVVALALFVFGMLWFTPWRLFTDDPVNESLPGAAPAADEQLVVPGMTRPAEPAALVEGRFVSLEHDSRGRAAVIETPDGKRYLRFEDFSTSNGPDLVVYLSTKVADANDWHGYDADFVDLGGLKGNVGNQNYEIPADVDLEEYSTAVVWCRRFEVGFAAADLA
ncbi:MAG: DM13 domain-containing protein [Actinomycetota bacterium]